ncbi:MAG: 16S rRNA (cytidine(1402)-2'-O)-methyltransferase [Endomicrobiia bacterium]
MKEQYGALYVVSTPIGNLEDITYRAVKVLNSVDLILCEDTRRTKILCDYYNINKPLKSYYSYIEKKRIKEIIPYIKQSHNVALVSDSGTPGISDPGFLIIKECINENIKVIPVPGPTAFVAMLVASGLPMDKVLFIGFIPKKAGKIKKIFNEIKSLKDITVVFYESPKRIKKTLEILIEIFPSSTKCVIGREITKIFEEFIRGELKELYMKLNEIQLKGEVVGSFYIE